MVKDQSHIRDRDDMADAMFVFSLLWCTAAGCLIWGILIALMI